MNHNINYIYIQYLKLKIKYQYRYMSRRVKLRTLLVINKVLLNRPSTTEANKNGMGQNFNLTKAYMI